MFAPAADRYRAMSSGNALSRSTADYHGVPSACHAGVMRALGVKLGTPVPKLAPLPRCCARQPDLPRDEDADPSRPIRPGAARRPRYPTKRRSSNDGHPAVEAGEPGRGRPGIRFSRGRGPSPRMRRLARSSESASFPAHRHSDANPGPRYGSASRLRGVRSR
jgi:hypothetical protein